MNLDENPERVGANTNEAGDQQGAGGASYGPGRLRREPTMLTLQDLIDLPRQILPEDTYVHLQNAGRETVLAVYTLWKSLNKNSAHSKTRRHIDVE